MGIKIETGENVITGYISGELDHHTAKDMREQLDLIVERVKPDLLLLDFRDVTFMDSSGIGLVMGRYRLVQSYGGQMKVINVSSYIKRVMKLAGLDTLVTLEGTKKADKQ